MDNVNKRYVLESPPPDKGVVSGLSRHPLSLLLYAVGIPAFSAITAISIANITTSQVLSSQYCVAVVAIVLISFIFAHYSFLAHKNTTEKISESMKRLEEEVRNMACYVRDIGEQLKLMDLGDTVFSEEQFKKVWLNLTAHTTVSFSSISYVSPTVWASARFKAQILVLGNMKAMDPAAMRVRRLFVIEHLSELEELKHTFKAHLDLGLEIKWVMKSKLIENNVLGGDEEGVGLNLSDESRGAVYYYNPDRSVSNGRMLTKPGDIATYSARFERAWPLGELCIC